MTPTTPLFAERRSAHRSLNERVLVRAPTGNDASLIAEILGTRGFTVVVAHDTATLVDEWAVGAGMVLIASEALNDSECCASLRHLFDDQEAWSEIPILLLGGSGEDEAPRVSELLGDRVQILILERPLGIATFLSATEAALRSRLRQYEVKRLLDELEASAETIARVHDEANHAKDEFLATLAHELRSPMAAIRGWVEMLKMGDLDPATATDALSMIESSANVQARIIEDLMDVSRILAGKAMIEAANIDMRSVVENVVATFRPAAGIEGIELISHIPTEPVLVFADAVRLQQVGWNLLSNAVKFTPRGGTVTISLTRKANSVELRVRDTGQGISPEMLQHVFERYRQEDRAANRPHRGLGLGLSIVRHLVEGHGGTIAAFSDGLGKGADFVVTLPVNGGT